MHACQVAAENEYLMVGNSVIISGVNRVRRAESGADFMDWGTADVSRISTTVNTISTPRPLMMSIGKKR